MYFEITLLLAAHVVRTFANGKVVAMKKMDQLRQPHIELNLGHERITASEHCQFLDSYLAKNNELRVVLEYMEGGALTDIIEIITLRSRDLMCIIRGRPSHFSIIVICIDYPIYMYRLVKV